MITPKISGTAFARVATRHPAEAPNTQIWTAGALIAIEPDSAPIEGLYL